MQQPTRLISTPFAQEGEKTEIQNVTGEFDNSATYRLGFPPLTMQSIRLGGKPPKGTDFNGVLFDITENISFLCKGGRYQYNAGLSTLIGGYPEGSNLLLDDNVTEVVSTVAGNQNNPNTDMTGWILKPNRTTAVNVADASGETQQQVNYNGGSKWHSRVGGYLENERVVLANGDIVKSTVDGNTHDPNVDMTGWVLVNSDGQIKTWSGRTQEERNKDVISLLDFNAPYSSDSTAHLQEALDYLSSKGGGVLKIPYHTGTLKIDGVINLRENVAVVCDENLVIDCTALTGDYSFKAIGTIDAEINTATNLTTGAKTVTTTAAHGLSVGDFFLLRGQRACAHEDAGEWQLGETTAGTTSPHFAEPLQVFSVNSTTSVTISRAILFPDYRTDKTLETSPAARDRTTIQKLNLLKGISWKGGVFKKTRWGVFQLWYCYQANIEAKFERGNDLGIEIQNRNCLASVIKAEVTRPVDWVLGDDHSNYNSVKDTSSWYSDITLTEWNGCQGLDQTFTDVCGLFPKYTVKSFNNREDGLTTHGCCYGAVVDAYVVGAGICGFRNRAPFTYAKLYAENCVRGLYTSSYGGVNCQFDVHVVGYSTYGVDINPAGVTSTAPYSKFLRISGTVIGSNYNGTGVFLRGYPADTTIDSLTQLTNLTIKKFNRAINVSTGVRDVLINNVTIADTADTSPIYFSGGSARISNVVADMSNSTDPLRPLLFYGASATPMQLDIPSIKVINGRITSSNGYGAYANVTLTQRSASVNVSHSLSRGVNNLIIKIGECLTVDGMRLTLSNTDPVEVGSKINVILIPTKELTVPQVGIYGFGADLNLIFGGSKTKFLTPRSVSVTEPVRITIERLYDNTYYIEIP